MLAFDPEIRDQAYRFFTQESLDFLQTLEAGLLDLGQNRSVPRIHTLMRAAHSIKGGAASVGLPAIQTLAHQFEDVMRVLYREDVEIDAALENLLLHAYDCLRIPLLEQVQTGHHDGEAALRRAEPIFNQLAERLGDALQNIDTALPTAAELGVDIVQTIFAGDVQDGLNRLTTVLGHPQGREVVGELRAQAEVFAGLGELVNLPGFTAIAHSTLAALDRHPDQALAIGQLALADFQAAQQQVLGGDRTQGGTPSPALCHLAQPSSLPNAAPAPSFHSPGPTLHLDPTPLPSDPTPSPSDLQPSTTAPVPYVPNTVRVDLPRLDRLNNLVGELITQENGSILQHQQLQSVVNRVVNRFKRFESISRELEVWSDRSQNTPARLPTRQADDSPRYTEEQAIALVPTTALLEEFDPLQMDSYSDLYALVQETMEEIAQMGEAMRDMGTLMQQAQQIQRHKQQTLKHIRNDLLWARMLPLGDILQRVPRMVRELANQYGKQVTVKLGGASTLVDKAILEKLYDPLVHLIRNAFDHGIESPEVRQIQGKAPQATITIRAYHRGNQTYIEVQDDGRGIDLEAVRARAIALKLVTPEVAAGLSTAQLYDWLFAPGLSTAEQVSALSGRGVGLDTVRSQVSQLKGDITITSEPGQGTTFILRLPLTLTIAKLLVFSTNAHLMAVPINTLVEIVMASADQLQTVRGEQFFRWYDQLIPLHSSALFNHNYLLIKPTSEQLPAMPLPKGARVPLLVLAGDSQVVAIQVDHILQEQELAIKPFGRAVTPPPYLYGCTILGDGSLVPVIDGPALVQQTQAIAPGSRSVPGIAAPPTDQERQSPERSTRGSHPPEPSSLPPTILVIDDSLTTRHNLAQTLKKAGYQVVQARDGREALDQLHQDSSIRAVFSDIEMPRMNGFEFLNHCRQKYARDHLPIIMLSSRNSQRHRQVAQFMGATDYLTKPYLEQDLLKTLRLYLA